MVNWNKRNITTIGRVALIKSLFLSKLNHIFLTIPSLDENLLQQIEDLFFKFLWQNKPDKIKRNCVTQNYEEGGLKMVDIRSFIKSLKITWVRRIFQTPDNLWVKLFNDQYCNPVNLITQGTNWLLLKNNVIKNRFWNEVLDAYRILLITYKPKNHHDLLSSPLCYNPNIGISNDLSKKIHNKGIDLIIETLDNNGHILSHHQLQNILGIHLTWYDYTIIKISVKRYLNSINLPLPESVERPLIPLNLKPIIKSQKGCKDFYNILNKKQNEVKATKKWNTKLDLILSKENWVHIFKIANKTIEDNTFKLPFSDRF